MPQSSFRTLSGVVTGIAVLALGAVGAWAGGAAAALGGEEVGLLERLHGDYACAHCRIERGLLWNEWVEEGDNSLRWSEATGADRANYPPDRNVDYTRMVLEIDIPDMQKARFTAKQRLEFVPLGDTVSAISLNAEQLDITSVKSDGPKQGVQWSHDGSMLDIRFEPALEAGSERAVLIEYACEDPVDGLFWIHEAPEWPGRPAQIHTQGQSESNRFWFPCHDSPNEQLSTELVVTVPSGYLVSSNGRLESEKEEGGRTTFHWVQEKPHVNYLVTLVVGKFDVVDVGRGEIDMPVYVPPGKGEWVEQTYGRTLAMTRVFEERFGLAYPWDRYAQLVVWNFSAGGMENTTATTMYDTAIFDARALQDSDLDGLISHELAHQWFGDLLTCHTWADIWLNEGWATYSTALWREARDGYDEGYLDTIYGAVRGVASRDRLDPKRPESAERAGMVSRLYEEPNHVFRRTSNPYPKGSSVLHMLRMSLGDDVFFRAVRTYVQRFAGKTVETADFRKVLEEVSGRSLEHFFEQWTVRPGTPEVSVDVSWNGKSNELKLVVEQTQLISAAAPAYAFALPIVISTGSEVQSISIDVMGRRHERTISLEEEPDMVIVDPGLTVLMTPKVKQPAARFIEQLRRGPTIAARLDAAEALKGHGGSKTVDALAATVSDTSSHHSLRSKAADALGDLRAVEALTMIAKGGVDDARVRRAVVGALGGAERPAREETLAILAEHAADDDESYATRAEALRALGRLGSREHVPILLAALDAESQHDQVRSAACSALAALDEPEGLDGVIRLAAFGNLNRLRPVAVGAVADLAHHDEDKAYEAVAPLLHDTESRARRAAVDALVSMKDERALPELRRIAQTARHAGEAAYAGRAADRLAAAIGRDDGPAELRREVERLKREVELLKERAEESK